MQSEVLSLEMCVDMYTLALSYTHKSHIGLLIGQQWVQPWPCLWEEGLPEVDVLVLFSFPFFLITIADFYSDVMHCKFIAGKIQVVLLTHAIPVWPYYYGTIKEDVHNISVKIHGLWPLDFFLFCLENHQPYRAHWLSVVDGPNNSACIHNTVSIYRCSEFYYYGPYVAPSWSCFWSISLLPWPRSFEHFVVTKQFT